MCKMYARVCKILWNHLTHLKPLCINLLRAKSVRWQWKHIHSFIRGLMKSGRTCLVLQRSWRIWQLELYLALCRLVDDRSQVVPKTLCAFLHIWQEGQVFSNYLILNTCSGDRCFYTNVAAVFMFYWQSLLAKCALYLSSFQIKFGTLQTLSASCKL